MSSYRFRIRGTVCKQYKVMYCTQYDGMMWGEGGGQWRGDLRVDC